MACVVTDEQQRIYNNLLDTGRRRELQPQERDSLNKLGKMRLELLRNRLDPGYEWDIEEY